MTCQRHTNDMSMTSSMTQEHFAKTYQWHVNDILNDTGTFRKDIPMTCQWHTNDIGHPILWHTQELNLFFKKFNDIPMTCHWLFDPDIFLIGTNDMSLKSKAMSLTCRHYYHLCLQNQKYVIGYVISMSLGMSSVCHWHKRTRLTLILMTYHWDITGLQCNNSHNNTTAKNTCLR
jgi:hypothetical protein